MNIGGNSTTFPIVAWPSIASNLPTYPSGARLSCDYTNSTNKN